MTSPTTGDSAYVQSLARGLSVITSFSADHRRQSLSQVAESTG
ncbi:MAG TPA: IclR family transcriptional regulator, partial [Corynebacterium sp.]|nr:IclR family transcriptional regulator [Corynebacterium sp.]